MEATADVTEPDSPSGWSRFLAALAQLLLLIAPIYGALILFRWPGRRDRYVRRQAGAACDFQLVAIAIWIVFVPMLPLAGALPDVATGLATLAWVLLYLVWWVGVNVYAVRGTIRAARGRDPGYPNTWHILRDREWPRPADR